MLRNDLTHRESSLGGPEIDQPELDPPEMEMVRRAIDVTLANHEPMPALVIDRSWNILGANAGLALFVSLLRADLPPEVAGNAARVSLHPDGLAPRIENFE